MNVINSVFEMKEPLKNTYIAIGNFDGIHLGHEKLIERCVKTAKKKNGLSVVFTFKNHPLEITNKNRNVKYINSNEEKLFLLEKMGVDYVILEPFTLEFSKFSPLAFLELLEEKLNIKEIFVGFNFSFGRNGSGKTKDLKYLTQDKDIIVNEIPPVLVDDKVISSTLIRQTLLTGDFNQGIKYLGHPMIIIGEVVHGKKIARKLGFPTANILVKNKIYPPFGIYGAILKIEGESGYHYGVVNIGNNPTLKPGEISVEVHILDFDEDIYHKKIYLYLLEYLRNEKKFESVEELIFHISNDVKNWENHVKENDYGYIFKN